MTRTIDQKKDTEIEDPIVQLKKILLADNLNSISQLEANLEHFKLQWNDRNWLIKTLDPIIISLLSKKINDSGDEIADVLAPVIGISIQKRIEVAREDIVDALYPVIGKSIRKSIAEAIKVLAQKVNDRIDRALSFDLILNKIKSKISGVNGASFLIQDAISYHIQEIFYIHKNTGVLLTHVHDRSVSPHNDEDIISGMLTAIRDFAKSAFIDKQAQDLSEIQYEDFQILIDFFDSGVLRT